MSHNGGGGISGFVWTVGRCTNGNDEISVFEVLSLIIWEIIYLRSGHGYGGLLISISDTRGGSGTAACGDLPASMFLSPRVLDRLPLELARIRFRVKPHRDGGLSWPCIVLRCFPSLKMRRDGWTVPRLSDAHVLLNPVLIGVDSRANAC